MFELYDLVSVLDFDEKILVLSSTAKVLYFGDSDKIPRCLDCAKRLTWHTFIDRLYVSIIDGECVLCIRLK